MKKTIIGIRENAYKLGYVSIHVQGRRNPIVRKAYPRKTGSFAGKFLINLDTDIYSFNLYNPSPFSEESQQPLLAGENIEYVGSYKSVKEAVEEKEKPVPVIVEVEPDGEIRHQKYSQIKSCVSNDIPVFLVGPAGSGKNHTLEQIAKDLGLDFHFTNSIQQEYKLTGFIDAGGNYHETEFYKAFKNGGLFFLDEMDASIPEVLVLLNAAIANKYFEFPNGKADAHENFRVVSAGNTVGNGSDESYTGRLVLDQATLDRFAIIEFDYDINIEMALAKGNRDLVTFIRDLRSQAKSKGIRSTFSYRCISMVTKLEGVLQLTDIMQIVVLKGLDKDTMNTFRADSSIYGQSLKKVQGL